MVLVPDAPIDAIVEVVQAVRLIEAHSRYRQRITLLVVVDVKNAYNGAAKLVLYSRLPFAD